MNNELQILQSDITNCIPINKNRDLYVLEASYRKIQHAVHRRNMAKPYFAFHLILSGKGSLITPSKTYPLSAGDIFIRFPSESIQYIDYPETPWSFIFITFQGNNAPAYLERLGFSPANRIFPTDDVLSCLFRDIVLKPNNHPSSADIIANGALAQIFSHLAVNYCLNAVSEYDNVDAYVNKALDYIETNLSDSSLSASIVAKYLSLNTDYFLRIFKQKTEVPFSKFIITKRMNNATKLIRDGENSIKIIADMVGYESPAYFTQSFKQIYSQLPSEYIKKHR